MEELLTTIGDRFKDARTSHSQHGKQTLKEVESGCNIDDSYLNKIENDNSKEFLKSVDAIRKLAEYYGVSADYLVGLSDSTTTKEDVKTAEKTTGLTHKAMKTLLAIKNSPYHKILDELLSDSSAMFKIVESINYAKNKSVTALHNVFGIEDVTKLGTISSELRHMHRDISEDIASAVLTITKYSSVKNAVEIQKGKLLKQEDETNE